MAVTNKDFRVKNGLIVEGAGGTINGFNILTEAQASIDFIVDTIGGTATSTNTPDTVVKRDANGDFAAGTITASIIGDITGDVVGNLTGDVTGNVSGNVTGNVTGDLTGNVTGDVTGNLTGNVTGTVSDISNHSTTDLSEGTNLYYTDTRARAALSGGTGITYDNVAGTIAVDGTIATESYVDTAVANLVDTAPDLLNTLNEIAAAIGDDPNFAASITTEIGTKVSKAGDTMTGELVLSGDPVNALGAAPKQYVDAAEAAANDYTDDEIAALSATVTALDTDDVAEGTNLYFTDERAQDAVAAAIAAGSHANITISYDDAAGSISFQAENGVADSDTDDLVEGTTNLYFTNVRAVAALEAIVPNFTEIDINSVATQIAATTSVATAGIATVYSFDSASYSSAEFVVKMANGVNTEISKVLLTLDTSNNVHLTEYGEVLTGTNLGNITASVNGTTIELQVNTQNNGTDVTVVGTLIV